MMNRSRLVGVTGVEPVTSSLSGTRSNQLSYTPFSAPAAPRRSSPLVSRPAATAGARAAPDGGGNRVRTGDPKLAKLVLFQLSYAPTRRAGRPPGPAFARSATGRSRRSIMPRRTSAFGSETVRRA